MKRIVLGMAVAGLTMAAGNAWCQRGDVRRGPRDDGPMMNRPDAPPMMQQGAPGVGPMGPQMPPPMGMPGGRGPMAGPQQGQMGPRGRGFPMVPQQQQWSPRTQFQRGPQQGMRGQGWQHGRGMMMRQHGFQGRGMPQQGWQGRQMEPRGRGHHQMSTPQQPQQQWTPPVPPQGGPWNMGNRMGLMGNRSQREDRQQPQNERRGPNTPAPQQFTPPALPQNLPENIRERIQSRMAEMQQRLAQQRGANVPQRPVAPNAVQPQGKRPMAERVERAAQSPRPMVAFLAELAKNREQITKRFDRDNDGQLSEREMAAMKQAFDRFLGIPEEKADASAKPKAEKNAEKPVRDSGRNR